MRMTRHLHEKMAPLTEYLSLWIPFLYDHHMQNLIVIIKNYKTASIYLFPDLILNIFWFFLRVFNEFDIVMFSSFPTIYHPFWIFKCPWLRAKEYVQFFFLPKVYLHLNKILKDFVHVINKREIIRALSQWNS